MILRDASAVLLLVFESLSLRFLFNCWDNINQLLMVTVAYKLRTNSVLCSNRLQHCVKKRSPIIHLNRADKKAQLNLAQLLLQRSAASSGKALHLVHLISGTIQQFWICMGRRWHVIFAFGALIFLLMGVHHTCHLQIMYAVSAVLFSDLIWVTLHVILIMLMGLLFQVKKSCFSFHDIFSRQFLTL